MLFFKNLLLLIIGNTKFSNDYLNFAKKFNKTLNFENNKIYNTNKDYINNINKLNLYYKLEENKFSDSNIFSNNTFIKRQNCYNCFEDINEKNVIPEYIDWRYHNAVTNVKNQGNCGSCWAFSTTGSVEGLHSIETGKLLNFSEQELVDCSKVNNGCQGGLMDNAFKFIINNGICTEDEYPYIGERQNCQSCVSKNVISDYSDVRENNELLLKRAVAKQPVSVAIQANLSSFRFYKTGIYSDNDCGDNLDHGVLIVGYGKDRFLDIDYWIVKNSWGPDWGENGYIRILRNYKDSPSGMCGIAIQPSFPTN